MDEQVLNSLQDVIRQLRELLDPIVQGVTDQAVRREILLALGLDPAQAHRSINIPPSTLASIDAYREQAADDVDLKAFIAALQHITQIVQALSDFGRAAAAADSNAPPGFIVEEAVSFLLNSTTLAYLRTRQPGVYIAAKALQLIEEQSLRFGGFVDLIFKTGAYFDELWGSADNLVTDADAKQVSDVALFLTGAVLSGVVAGGFIYGYDAGPGSTSPLADDVSNRP